MDLDRLTRAELLRLRERIDLKLSTSAQASEHARYNDLINETLEQLGIAGRNYQAVKRGDYFRALRDGVRYFEAYVDRFGFEGEIERAKGVRELLKVMALHLRDCGYMPLTHKTLTQSLLRAGQIVQEEFPGATFYFLRSVLLSGAK